MSHSQATAKSFERLRARIESRLNDAEIRSAVMDSSVDDIERQFRKPDPRVAARAAACDMGLQELGSWNMARGAIAVLKGQAEGWQDVRAGLLYQAWGARIRHALTDRLANWDENPCNPSMTYHTEAHTLLAAIATGFDPFSHGFGRHLISNFRRFGGGDRVFFYTEPLGPYAYRLYCTWVGEEHLFRDDVPDPLKGYQGLFDAWNDPEAFAAAVHAVCDLHVAETTDKKNPYAAFVFPPYDIFPTEILALFRVRRELGLSVPVVEHPWLETALCEIPPPLPTEPDSFLSRVIDFVRKDFGEIALPPDWR